MIRFEHDGSGGVEAVADVDVGARRRSIRVPLGPWTRSEADAEGLCRIPVVIAIDSGASDVIMAGVHRAGPPAVIAESVSSEEPVGGRLLAAARRGTEVLLVVAATDGSLLDQVTALRGRVVPALPLGRPESLTSLFAGSTLEVDLPVPGMHGAVRAAIRERIAAISLDSRRLVEVDPRPAFEEAGLDFETADLDALGAAAAGVLAGRLAAANRRWRDAD